MFSLKARDWIKGLIIAVGTPVLYLLQELIPNYPLTPIEKAALSATVTYLLKNFFTDDVKAAQKIVDANATQQMAAPNDAELNKK